MAREHLERVWCKPNFKKFILEMKVDHPNKKIPDILDIVADEVRENKKKKRGSGDFLPRF